MEEDMRRRGLRAGDVYLTAREAARVFGVHPRMASRAMRRLAERQVLVRKQGVGTFIGPALDAGEALALRVIHVLISPDRYHAALPVGELTAGLLDSLQGHDLQLNILPGVNAAAHVRRLVKKAANEGWLTGLVLLGCSREVQEATLESAAPAVVFGGVFATTQRLPSVDMDQREAGRLMARYVVQRGHRRAAFLTRDTWLPGDNQLLDGVNDVLSDAGLNQGALVMRSLPVDADAVTVEVEHLLAEHNPPTALICRGRFFGRAAFHAAHKRPHRNGLDVIGDTEPTGPQDEVPWAHVNCEMDYREQAAEVGRALRDRLEADAPEPSHTVLPVRLIAPPAEKSDHPGPPHC
jgi:LacI family transcriptional regulator